MQEQVELHFTHPDDFRQWVMENKSRDTVEKVMTEQEAVSRFVPDGAYLAYDFSSLTRGPGSGPGCPGGPGPGGW